MKSGIKFNKAKFNKMRENLQELEDIGDFVGVGLAEGAKKILDNSLDLAPEDTGNLKKTSFLVGKTRQDFPSEDLSTVRINEKGKARDITEEASRAVANTENVVTDAQQEVIDDNKKEFISVIVGYGAHYAAPVHEGVFAGGKVVDTTKSSYKYLERPLMEGEKGLRKSVSNTVRAKIRGIT